MLRIGALQDGLVSLQSRNLTNPAASYGYENEGYGGVWHPN